MHVFFLALATTTTALLGVTTFKAYFAANTLTHFSLGLMSAVFVLITHCFVFFYFIGTGQGIREGVLQHGLDTAAIKKTKRFKAKTFPFALFSMIFAITATTMGGAVHTDKLSPPWHVSFVAVTLLFNLFSFYQEWRAIRENQRLMKELNALINQ